MAGKIPEQFIQDILARTDLVELIDAKVPLKRSGSNFMARCPFHSEKTPSFSVNRDKQFYYCFGCGARGTAISFLMDYDRLSFPEAIETLADALGLPVPREQGEGADRKSAMESAQALYSVLERASRFYQQQLKIHPDARRAVDYLRQRGVSGEIARRYSLGFAPPGYQSLPGDWSRALLQSAGLQASSQPGRSHDWFRDRIMFPIRDRRSRIVGFGGRIIDEGTPKYLNSPETDVFHKHREVYGLFELLEVLRKPDCIVVVEGYMDVIALAQFGIENAVATLGTATSTDQVGLLFRYTSTVVFCFDGDNAGRNAAWKALDSSLVHLREGRQLRFLLLPEGQDPDSMVRAEGLEAFMRRVEMAQPFSEYFFEHLAEGLDLGTIEGRSALVGKAQPLIHKLSPGVFREMIEARLESLAGHAVKGKAGVFETREVSRVGSSRPATTGRPSAMRTFLALLLQNPNLIEHVDSYAAERLTQSDRQGPLVGAVIEFLMAYPQITVGGVIEGFRDTPHAEVISRLIAWDTQVMADAVEAAFLDYLHHLTEVRVKDGRLETLIIKSRDQKLSIDELEELRRLTNH
jgi:DNA primase